MIGKKKIAHKLKNLSKVETVSPVKDVDTQENYTG
jgi:hypothetical protein